jgi:hypothetical protein
MNDLVPNSGQQPPADDRDEFLKLYDQLDHPRKKAFLNIMKQTFGNISQSCNTVGISRTTYANWKKHDPLFATILAATEYEEEMLDYAESKLVDRMTNKDTAAIIFFLKTKGKKRGYVEKQQLEIKGRGDGDKPSWFSKEELPADLDSYVEDIEHEEVKPEQSKPPQI